MLKIEGTAMKGGVLQLKLKWLLIRLIWVCAGRPLFIAICVHLRCTTYVCTAPYSRPIMWISFAHWNTVEILLHDFLQEPLLSRQLSKGSHIHEQVSNLMYVQSYTLVLPWISVKDLIYGFSTNNVIRKIVMSDDFMPTNALHLILLP